MELKSTTKFLLQLLCKRCRGRKLNNFATDKGCLQQSTYKTQKWECETVLMMMNSTKDFHNVFLFHNDKALIQAYLTDSIHLHNSYWEDIVPKISQKIYTVFTNTSITTGTLQDIYTYQGHEAESSQQDETTLYTPLSLDGHPHQSVELVSICKTCYNYCKS